MNVFTNYAQYYDLLNNGKDYQTEAEYVYNLIKKYLPTSKKILDIGCGTGMHDIYFAKNGFIVHGIDQSKEMISIAQSRSRTESCSFSQADARNFKLNEQFDVVTALFHVISYQITDDDLMNTFRSIHYHLNKNGLLVFDCWHGPAVLNDRPYQRTKTFENSELLIRRNAHPTMLPVHNIVDVNFDIIVKNKKTGEKVNFQELHKMRYLFDFELSSLLSEVGFELITSEEWMTGKEPSDNTWYVTYIALKK